MEQSENELTHNSDKREGLYNSLLLLLITVSYNQKTLSERVREMAREAVFQKRCFEEESRESAT